MVFADHTATSLKSLLTDQDFLANSTCIQFAPVRVDRQVFRLDPGLFDDPVHHATASAAHRDDCRVHPTPSYSSFNHPINGHLLRFVWSANIAALTTARGKPRFSLTGPAYEIFASLINPTFALAVLHAINPRSIILSLTRVIPSPYPRTAGPLVAEAPILACTSAPIGAVHCALSR